MKRNIVRRIAQTRLGYWLWSATQGTALARVLKNGGEVLRFSEERLLAALPKNRRHDAVQRAILERFETETKVRGDS